MKENNNFYLIASFALSKDKYHKRVGLRHLIGSIFYTCDLKWDILVNKELKKSSHDYLIVKLSQDITIPYFKIEGNIIYINIYYFFGFDLRDLDLGFNHDNALDILFKSQKFNSEDHFDESFLSQSIFIFENISWSDLQLLFRYRLIQISGGSVTRRHLVSTVQFLLLKYLISQGYSKEDIYNSNKLLLNINNRKESLDWSDYKCQLIKNILHTIINEEIDSLNNQKKSIENELFKLKREQSGFVSAKQKELENIELLIIRQYNIKFELNNMSFESLRSLYLDNYFNQHRSYDLKLKSLFNKSIIPNKKPLNKREYSTYIRNVDNTLILGKNHLNNYKFDKKRNISINSTSSSNKLLELLYSSDNKEEVQINIEKYLINEQNSFILNKASTTPINFSLLNKNVSNQIIASIENIRKLYNKSLKSKIFPEDDKFNNILHIVDFEYIINILLGRLLLIMTNNNRSNKFTFITEVAYDLGKELINDYNYKQYVKNKTIYNSFSLFKDENPDKIINDSDVTKVVLLGNILLGWLKELKLISSKVEILNKTEKRNILIIGDLIKNLIEVNKVGLINLPTKIPMIVPPKKMI